MKPIIYADDDRDIWEPFGDYLMSEFGIPVDGAADGSELVEKVQTGDYGLVITDDTMPEMTGMQAIREIRKFEPNIPIIMVGGNDAKASALEAGTNAYFEKPVGPDRLANKIIELVP